MTGAFYGALASSASVFVAILSALLVNNYVQIKSEKSQTTKELERAGEDLGELEVKRDDLQGTVDDLIEKREAGYRSRAEERVGSFIEVHDFSKRETPIERLRVDDVYQELVAFHDCESVDDLEHSDEEQHHRDVLEERFDEIRAMVLEKMVDAFAESYRGRGRDPAEGWPSEEDKEELDGDDEDEWHLSKEETDEGVDVKVLAEVAEWDKIELDEFIQEYKELYDLDDLDPVTRELLEEKYDNVVAASSLSRLSELVNRSRQGLNPDLDVFPETILHSQLGLNSFDRQRLVDTRKELRDVENQISTLKRRKARLERKKEGLNPEGLMPVLTANIVTILLSVVVPIIAYLLVVTENTVSLPGVLSVFSHTAVNAFVFWLAGLAVVFESIHARINDRDPATHVLYNRVLD